jgi:hypothetical protein
VAVCAWDLRVGSVCCSLCARSMMFSLDWSWFVGMRRGSGMNHSLASSSSSRSGWAPLTSLTGMEDSWRKCGRTGWFCAACVVGV